MPSKLTLRKFFILQNILKQSYSITPFLIFNTKTITIASYQSFKYQRFALRLFTSTSPIHDHRTKVKSIANEFHIIDDDGLKLIESFLADFSQVMIYKQNGKFNQAIEILERIYNIISNATGKSSINTLCILHILLSMYYHSKNITKIESIIYTTKNNNTINIKQLVTDYPVEFQIKALLALSICRLHVFINNNNTITNNRIVTVTALNTQSDVFLQSISNEVNLAMSLCETIDTKVSNSHFSYCYGIKGKFNALITQ